MTKIPDREELRRMFPTQSDQEIEDLHRYLTWFERERQEICTRLGLEVDVLAHTDEGGNCADYP